MLRRDLTFAVPLLLVALAAGCGEGGTDGGASGASSTPTAEATAATATPAVPTPAPDIRDEDLTSQPGLQEFLASEGGEVVPGDSSYTDLTEDGVEEAVVHVSSGGTLGNLAVFVFGYGPDGLQELLREIPPVEALRGHIRATEEAGQLVITWPIYGPDDPNCCPSGGFRSRYYQWDGQELVIEREDVTPPDEAP